MLWTDDKRQYVKRSTISAYLLILENHINPEFGDEYGLKEEDIQDFAMKKLRQGLSRKSVKDILTVLKMVLKYGVRYGHLDSNISTTLDLYVHPDFDQKRRCVEQMSRSLK